ncbi:MAG: 2OG-Fe(II) oxygenase [Candidatus Sulfotelmatobacter sp.]
MLSVSKVLANRAWLCRTQPFPHIVARQVFASEFYSAMEAQYRQILAMGLNESQTARRGTFSRTISGYDAYGLGFDKTTGGAMSVFGSLEWHDLMGGLFGVAGTGHVNLGAHHHAIGSADGFIHNDFNPVWFRRDSAGSIHYPDHRQCAYKTGAGPLPASGKVEVVRAVAMIFYLSNGGWVEGDGGETGLFDSAFSGTSAARIRVPPENNSILLFECTPNSYHAFLHNPGRTRNSIIMWIHRSKTNAISRWPESALEGWRF